jgi:glycosyltransferase involved in cell wall biosynthesis
MRICFISARNAASWGEKTPMKFHFVSLLTRLPWGGSEQLWTDTAVLLKRNSHDISASVKWWPEEQISPGLNRLREIEIPVYFWGAAASFSNRLKALLQRLAHKIQGTISVASVDYKIMEADLIVFSSPGNEFPSVPIRQCVARGQRYVLIIQSVSEGYWPKDSELEDWRLAYENAAAAFFVSHANRDSTVFQIGFERDCFKVISNPCNVSREIPFSWPVVRETHRWAFVGRLEPEHKGIDLLLRAFAREHWKGRNVQISIFGQGLSEKSVKRMAQMLHVDGRLNFQGVFSRVEDIWRNHELLILPSRHEGLPLAVIEAMMCGRPCLVTNVSGNPEHVVDGSTGFIAAGATVDAVDAALERAWLQREQLKDMGRAAHTAIRQQIPVDPIQTFAEELIQATR